MTPPRRTRPAVRRAVAPAAMLAAVTITFAGCDRPLPEVTAPRLLRAAVQATLDAGTARIDARLTMPGGAVARLTGVTSLVENRGMLLAAAQSAGDTATPATELRILGDVAFVRAAGQDRWVRVPSPATAGASWRDLLDDVGSAHEVTQRGAHRFTATTPSGALDVTTDHLSRIVRIRRETTSVAIDLRLSDFGVEVVVEEPST